MPRVRRRLAGGGECGQEGVDVGGLDAEIDGLAVGQPDALEAALKDTNILSLK